MRRFKVGSIVLLVISLLLTASTFTTAQDASSEISQTDPESVIRSHYSALNQGDVESAMALVAEDAVMVFIPPPPGFDSALDKIGAQEWLQTFASRNGRVDITEIYVHGDKAAFSANVTEDFFTSVGVPYMFANYVAIVQRGQIKSATITFEEASQAVFDVAFAEEQNKEMIRRGYDEMWSQGNMELVDELHHPDFVDNHTGQTGTESIHFIVNLFREAFPDMKITYNNMVAEGDIVVTEVTFELGAYQGGMEEVFGIPDSAIGTEVTRQGIDYARFKDGQIIEAWGKHDSLGWMEQFGFTLTPPEE